VVALTDHDSLEGLEEGEAAAQKEGIRLIRGVELSLEFPIPAADQGQREHPGEFHLLGLGISRDCGELDRALEKLREARENRNLRIIEKMNRGGIRVRYEDILAEAGALSGPNSRRALGRPHFARFLVKAGAASSLGEAFERFLKKGQPFYEPKKNLSLDAAAGLLTRAGALPVVAHPLSLRFPLEELGPWFALWKAAGVRGIEAVHPSANRSQSRRLEALALGCGLLVSAGSDFHGDNVPSRKLGETSWNARIPRRYSRLLAALASEVNP
jgi:predicted metal-dependent phosphoesterase TrpH